MESRCVTGLRKDMRAGNDAPYFDEAWAYWILSWACCARKFCSRLSGFEGEPAVIPDPTRAADINSGLPVLTIRLVTSARMRASSASVSALVRASNLVIAKL